MTTATTPCLLCSDEITLADSGVALHYVGCSDYRRACTNVGGLLCPYCFYGGGDVSEFSIDKEGWVALAEHIQRHVAAGHMARYACNDYQCPCGRQRDTGEQAVQCMGCCRWQHVPCVDLEDFYECPACGSQAVAPPPATSGGESTTSE